MKCYRLDDRIELSGEWFLGGVEDCKRISGQLVWSDRQAVVSLHGTFTPLTGAIYGDEIYTYSCIHGITTSSSFVTLLEAGRAGLGMYIGSAGLSQPERLRTSLVVLGAHVAPDTLYSEIRARIPGLEIWLSRGGTTREFLSTPDGRPLEINYSFRAMPEESFDLPIDGVTIGFGIDRNFSGDIDTHVSVTTSACIRIKSREGRSLDWFFEQLAIALELIAMISGSSMSASDITAKLADTDQSVDLLVGLSNHKCCQYKNSAEFFMCRSDTSVQLGELFRHWFSEHFRIAMPTRLALSTLYSEGLWNHIEFLSLTQVLEGFHRAILPGKYMTDEDYEAVRATLSNSIPTSVQGAHRDSLKSRIRFGNEVSLQKRLCALIERLDPATRRPILGGDKVPRSWVDTRNYYTHWDSTSKDQVLDGVEMHYACLRMRTLVRALLLDYAGVPQAAIRKSLENACKESQQLIQLNNTEFRRQNPNVETTPIMVVTPRTTETDQSDTSEGSQAPA